MDMAAGWPPKQRSLWKSTRHSFVLKKNWKGTVTILHLHFVLKILPMSRCRRVLQQTVWMITKHKRDIGDFVHCTPNFVHVNPFSGLDSTYHIELLVCRSQAKLMKLVDDTSGDNGPKLDMDVDYVENHTTNNEHPIHEVPTNDQINHRLTTEGVYLPQIQSLFVRTALFFSTLRSGSFISSLLQTLWNSRYSQQSLPKNSFLVNVVENPIVFDLFLMLQDV